MRRIVAFALAFSCAQSARAEAPKPPPALVDYVRKDDKAFSWKQSGKIDLDGGAVYELDLTSQKWQGLTWTHKLQVFIPKGVKPRATMVLYNQGGSPNTASGILGVHIAQKVGAPIAFLYGIPNQPLFGGQKEDALIAETFVRYLETKDPSWPLLFPMVKSLVKAMDALQAFAKNEWNFAVTHFVVTGASKRGWTSWLTAATGDKRVKAIAPLVIDTLNFPVQMKNQVQAFGKPSEMIRDYTQRNLVPIPANGDGQKLWKMVDPWVYRDGLTVPKLIINGANDPYWPLDALNSYWDDLKGEKHLLYVPNAGHDLRETDKNGKKELIPQRAINTLCAFCKCQVFDKPMPRVQWQFAEKPDRVECTARCDFPYKKLRFCTATSETRDFRKSNWTEQLFVESAAATSAASGLTLQPPSKGCVAGFIETEFEMDGLNFRLSTQLRILEAKK
jgi:PhoPQ-activated pathogenicity-related protein